MVATGETPLGKLYLLPVPDSITVQQPADLLKDPMTVWLLNVRTVSGYTALGLAILAGIFGKDESGDLL